ncbi:MAG: FkbM family methyltransferase [Geminicoccaceae bacterium]
MTETHNADVHRFANGIQVYKRDLLPVQLERYADHGNVHEPVEEFWLEKLLSEIDAPTVSFLDIGCALGYYSLLVRRRFPSADIVAVDPNPEMGEKFWQTLALNDAEDEGVSFLSQAIFPDSATVRLALKTFSTHVVQPNQQHTQKAAEEISVPAIDLPTLLKRIARPIDIAKMDIQGAELDVLQQAAGILKDGQVAHWLIGTHSAYIHRSLLELLSEAYEIVFEESAPKGQPDGLITAAYRK